MSVAALDMKDLLGLRGWDSTSRGLLEGNAETYQVSIESGRFTKLQVPFYVRVPKSMFGNVLSLKPIQVSIQYIDDYFVASSESLHIYATGDTPSATIEDFSDQVIHFFHYYSALPPNEITGDAAQLKEIFETQFRLIEHAP